MDIKSIPETDDREPEHIVNEMLEGLDQHNDRLSKLEVEMRELRFEAIFYKATTLVVLIWVAFQSWHHFF